MSIPLPVSNYIAKVHPTLRAAAYLRVDNAGVIVEAGGALEAYGLDQLTPGIPARDVTLFLEGMLPLDSEPIFLPGVHFAPEVIADIHLFRDEDCDWVLLLGAESHEARQILQQKSHELALLSERIQKQNTISETASSAVLRALDIWVIERLQGDVFISRSPTPQWAEALWPDITSSKLLSPFLKEDAFLSNFLTEARQLWTTKKTGKLRSGFWTETHPGQLDTVLEATAIQSQNLSFLLIQEATERSLEKRRVIQTARENCLELKEKTKEQSVIRSAWDNLEKHFTQRTAELFRMNQLLFFDERKQTNSKNADDIMLRALHSVAEMIYVTDAHLRFVLVNPVLVTALGYRESELTGRQLNLIISDRTLANQLTEISRQAVVGDWKGEIQIRGKDGNHLPCYLNNNPIQDERGQIVGFVGFIQDLSERKKDEEIRKERESKQNEARRMEALGRLAGGIAHDFNNVLTVLMTQSEYILSETQEGGNVHNCAKGIFKATTHGASLTGQLLAFSRRQVLKPATISLNTILDGIKELTNQITGSESRITRSCDPNLGNIHADPGQMEQVAINLLVNAKDATPDDGELFLSTRNVSLGTDNTHKVPGIPDETPDSGEYVMLQVRDRGIGMDENTRARLFEPFYTTKASGTGLGLSTVYGIVKQSGGYIFVESRPNEGTTFSVCIPRV